MGKSRLPRKVNDAVTRLCKEGDDLAAQGKAQAAYDKYDEAWNLLPEDKAIWEASTWILGAIGELQFRRRSFEKALNTYLRAVQCPNGLGNPYIHLRIGQCQFELGNLRGAGDNLARAYMAAGEEMFEQEDQKYLAFLRTVLLPPAS